MARVRASASMSMPPSTASSASAEYGAERSANASGGAILGTNGAMVAMDIRVLRCKNVRKARPPRYGGAPAIVVVGQPGSGRVQDVPRALQVFPHGAGPRLGAQAGGGVV